MWRRLKAAMRRAMPKQSVLLRFPRSGISKKRAHDARNVRLVGSGVPGILVSMPGFLCARHQQEDDEVKGALPCAGIFRMA
jgi:hypothetical protein